MTASFPHPVPQFRLQWVGEPAPASRERPPGTAAGVAQVWADSIAASATHEAHIEHAAVFVVGENNSIAGYRLLAKGSGNSVAISPLELLLTAACAGAGAVLVAHSHPNQDLTPSDTDIEWTRRASVICELAGVRLLDHVIVPSRPPASQPLFASLRALGHFSKFDVDIATRTATPAADQLERLLFSDVDVAIALQAAARRENAEFFEFAGAVILELLRSKFLLPAK